MNTYDIIIIGAGPAGLAAAIAAKEAGVDDVLVIERDSVPGGILNQCIHNGFGLHTFREELTGPEYAARFLRRAEELGVAIRLSTMVLSLTNECVLTVTSRERGVEQLRGRAVILAMGCRERPRGALNIPGYRPAGIYSAGTAQRLVNLEGFMPGREVVILGSGDIGLIMARRMTLEGAHVKCVAELLPYSGGLKRNIVQCLHDYDIPLLLSHTVVDIHGRERLEGVTLAEVGPDRKPVPGSEKYIPCDTLLLSVGLLPENELSEGAEVTLDRVTGGPAVNESLETNVPGFFACGNVLHVHDLVDYVSEEAARAGRAAAKFVRGGTPKSARVVKLTGRDGVRYTVPQTVRPAAMGESVVVRFRVANPYYGKYLSCYVDGERISHRKKQIMARSPRRERAGSRILCGGGVNHGPDMHPLPDGLRHPRGNGKRTGRFCHGQHLPARGGVREERGHGACAHRDEHRTRSWRRAPGRRGEDCAGRAEGQDICRDGRRPRAGGQSAGTHRRYSLREHRGHRLEPRRRRRPRRGIKDSKPFRQLEQFAFNLFV